ncbi:transcription repressor NadR [Alkalibacillus aidingensis]|uniref:transcription repressor NadR n=1 Tax=Alkalibacillus aidingensis TaxID=2747607 RepID=UPI001660A4E1|nr:transcription repressor NadR [Alkalibacillus aidingensis]
MSDQKKLRGEERRQQILQMLTEAKQAISGKELANQFSVSRQVIVGDVALLKAKNNPIISTSQGYVFMNESEQGQRYERKIVCKHNRQETMEELNILVDHGVFVEDVIVDHPIYGEFTALLHIANRVDVKRFIEQLEQSQATLLLELTGGVHIHTITADEYELLDQAEQALKKAGIVVGESD